MTPERLRALLHYDPETGVFTWRVDRSPKTRAGDVAGCLGYFGYVYLRVDYRSHKAHRLAWLYVHGEWPSDRLDHKDGNPANNRLSNLRVATAVDNRANSRPHRGSRTGVKGVFLEEGRYRARIMRHGKRITLGSFSSLDAASAAYAAASESLCGEFARLA